MRSLSIRGLLWATIGVFALVSGGAGLWQLEDSRAKVTAVQWVNLTNHMAGFAQQAGAALAMERGATAALLARAIEPDAFLHAEMVRARQEADAKYTSILMHAESLARLMPDHPLFDQLSRLEADRALLSSHRQQVDEQLHGKDHGLDVARWIALLVRCIEGLQDLAVVSMLPLEGNGYARTSLPIIKDVLFTFSEYLGRERAVIGAAIARGSPLTEAERELLNGYRAVTVRSHRRAESILRYLSSSPELERARETFQGEQWRRYEALRTAVHAASRAGETYPVDVQGWYRNATSTIDAVLDLSEIISSQIDRDLNQLYEHAANTRKLLAMLLGVLALLIVAVAYALSRHVLRPLRTLEQSASAISAGDLSQPLPSLAGEEFGRLGRAFEHMRTALLDEARRREADARELRKLNALIEHSASAMIVTDAEGTIEYTNASFRTMTGYSNEEAVGRKAGFWQSGMTSQDEYRELWSAARGGRIWEGELINRRKNGEMYWASVTVSPVLGEDGAITHYIGIQNDISARRRIEERLSFLTSYDELTRLPNAASLSRYFAQMRVAAAFSGAQIGLVSLGICHFKRINDSMGCNVGDQLLCEIAQRLTSCVQTHDMVARVGGTEFTVMIASAADAAEIHDRVERIIETANLPVVIQGEQLQPCVRAGVSLMAAHDDSFGALLRKATVALHHAERQELSSFRYSDALDRDALERLSLENALRQALENDALELHYQPKVDLGSGRVVGVEALARWFDPVCNEYVPPARFIPVAEESGLIAYLGAWALCEACRQNRAWQDAGLPPVVVAVNLSALQLRQPNLVSVVAETLNDSGLEAHWLELELTESALMEDPDQANRVLSDLKALGLRLAIDDFGTGYSSLAYLSRFPVNQLKIDRGFVRNITTDHNAAAISTSVIALAHQMKLTVIAEGVETAEQLDFLVAHGCDEIQGYYASRPLAASQLAQLLGRNDPLITGSAGDRTPVTGECGQERD
jgi:diguanylate cyclase (GGDEF)-like protein/PAS domain S-box-containing protein